MAELQTILSSGGITNYQESAAAAGNALQTLDEIESLIAVTTYFGSMYLNANTNAQTPVADQVIGMTNFVAGNNNGFVFEAGEAGTIASTADNGTDVTITCGAGHTVDVGDYVVIYQDSTVGSYDITGTYLVTAEAATTFDIAFANWDASETGIWQSPSQLKLTAAGVSSINYSFNWNLSASAAGSPSGDVVDWVVYKNSVEQVPTEARRTLSIAGAWGSFSGQSIIPLSTNDIVYLTFHSDDVNAITHRYGSFNVHSLGVASP